MKKRLSLKTEHLTELTAAELALAAGAGNDSFTGRVDCILSLEDPCVSAICLRTVLCNVS
ncbi:MAG TPA: hypothetical protein VF519_08695 [Mycobacteriales bacterium]